MSYDKFNGYTKLNVRYDVNISGKLRCQATCWLQGCQINQLVLSWYSSYTGKSW